MRQKAHPWLALLLALLFAVQMLPFSAVAQEERDSSAQSSAQTTESEGETPAQEGTEAAGTTTESDGQAPVSTALAPDWEGTGAVNSDGTPVTAEQGDLPQDDGDGTTSAPSQPSEPASYTLTLELDGGQINNLQNTGWTQSSNQTYQWFSTRTEPEPGQGLSVTPDATLGGLLPGTPYRAGYAFVGWTIGDTDYDLTASALTLQGDATITARWEITTYTVRFQTGGGHPDWTVQVPYGATLWVEPETPWTGEDVVWSAEDTAVMDLMVGDTLHPQVQVTRHPEQGAEMPGYYYTFTIDGVPYFTYGGEVPAKQGHYFASWKLISGGSGFTVLEDAVFAPQFQAEQSYVFNIYYYYEDGTRAGETTTVTKTRQDISNGTFTFTVPIPEIDHYTSTPDPQPGVSWNGREVTVDVDTVFGEENASVSNFLALTVTYAPAEIQYTIRYHQQPVGVTDYTQYEEVGQLQGSTFYGTTIPVPDRPDLGADVSFEGFLASRTSQTAISGGVTLREGTPNTTFDTEGNAVVDVYYDRSSYFIYFQTGTTEAQLDPIKVVYGAAMPGDLGQQIATLSRTGYKPVDLEDVTWYRLDAQGGLQQLDAPVTPQTQMPAHDIYAVVSWTPDTTSIRIAYWVESRNAASFQNAYITTVNDVPTESYLTVNLNGTSPTIDGLDNGTQIVRQGFEELIEQHYAGKEYATFFSYSSSNTKTSPGNVADAITTDTGGVQNEAITEDTYQVQVSGDGTTTINVYYTRNLYTLEFILARQRDGGNIQVATNTPGSFSGSVWQTTEATQFQFASFGNEVTESDASGTTYGQLQVRKVYRLTEALQRDPRSPVGRYGTRTIYDGIGDDWGNYTCYVYTLTARFEADITTLWPTVANLKDSYSNDTIHYISMGSDSNSYYRLEFTKGGDQHNVLNSYSSMDQVMVARGNASNWTATADPVEGRVTHSLVAYWAQDASEYHYYFFYEVLDTTITPSSSNVKGFWPAGVEDAGRNDYQDGDLIITKEDGNKHVYVYDADWELQYSTSDKNGQNPPSRHGFQFAGKSIYNGTGTIHGGNIYFFYTREDYTLDIQNEGVNYLIPESLLTQPFDCLGGDTLQKYGWESVDNEGKAHIRFGGHLDPLAQEEVIQWLTSEDGGALDYPYGSAGENQYYFHRWYRNVMQTVPVDWENDNEMMNISFNQTLYAGWFTPRYTTTYALNGGTWQDSIDYTMTTVAFGQDNLYIFYPHQTQALDAPVYWYIQSKSEDRLFVDVLYTCSIGQVGKWDEAKQHWVSNGTIQTVDDLMQISEVDMQGTRLINHYYCYMGAGGVNNHDYYVNINATVNSVLEEPTPPSRNGYLFSGWYYFGAVPTDGEKTYLRDVLSENESLASYGPGYVYLNHVGDAFLLYEDGQGELYYFADQPGYRFSYTNSASVVSRDLRLYAAWRPTGDALGTVYHLIPRQEVTDTAQFTPKGGTEALQVSPDRIITINGVEYYILEEEPMVGLYTGNTYHRTAREYYTDGNSRRWLPAQAEIDLQADQRTQTVEAGAPLENISDNTYRVLQDDGSYAYYAFFLYGITNQVSYNVYAIDLSVAVAEGALSNYQDTFDRTFQMDPKAPYCLQVEQKWVQVNDITSTVVEENAPAISGYTVYEDWNQRLQLQTQVDANNLFFYYVRDTAKVQYTIHFYLMQDGGYSKDNLVTVSGIPAVSGEIISLSDLGTTFDRLIHQAMSYSSYGDSDNEAQKSLYERYRGMTITYQGGETKRFTVDTGDTDTLDLQEIAEVPLDYYVDGWSPTGDSLVISDGTTVDVYLGTAHLVIQKTDQNQHPLAGATFTLERLVASEDGDILQDGVSYRVDPSFTPLTSTSGADGKAYFHNLSARIFEERGSGYLYRLTETQAPRGYNCLEAPLYVTTPYVLGDEIHYTVTYTVVNTGIVYLPGSGSFGGVYPTTFLGISLMAGALGCGAVVCRRRRERFSVAKKSATNR